MIPAAFGYVRASTVVEALDALADPEAKALAGGHSLIPAMKIRLSRPSLLVDLGRLDDLRGIEEDAGELRIGALTTYDAAARALATVTGADALRECVEAIGDVQVRNAGTVGGGLAHGDPASDVAAGVLALGARLRLRSRDGTREVPADAFFLGPFTTALGRQELLVEAVVPLCGPGEGSAYASIEDAASGYPLAGAAVRLRLEGGAAADCALGVTGFTGAPRRLPGVEALVRRDGRVDVAGITAALADVEVMTDDAPYRRQLAAVAIARALGRAWERAEGRTG